MYVSGTITPHNISDAYLVGPKILSRLADQSASSGTSLLLMEDAELKANKTRLYTEHKNTYLALRVLGPDIGGRRDGVRNSLAVKYVVVLFK